MEKDNNSYNFLGKTWFPLTSGTIINIGIYFIFGTISQWTIVLIYFIAVIPEAIRAYRDIRLAEIDAKRQVRRDEIHR